MVYLSIALLALFSLQSSGLSHRNESLDLLISFSGYVKSHQVVMVTVEPKEFLDLSALDDLGSGSEPDHESVREDGHRDPHHPPKKHPFVSAKVKSFLQGRLATAFVPTVYVLVYIVSVPLNIFAIVMFVRRIQPRKPIVIYMLNMACADLLYALLLPFKIDYHYHGNNWTYGSLMCRVVTAAFYCNMFCSVLLMMFISMERLMAVVYPVDSLIWRSPQTASAACVATWLLALGGVIPLLSSGQTIHLPDLGITTCHDVQSVDTQKSFYIYFFPIYSSIFFFIPLVFTAACFIRIVQAQVAANTKYRVKKTRAMVMAVVVLVVFAACFTPANIILIVHYVKLVHVGNDSSYQAYLVSICISSISCCLDPVMYYFGSSQYRRQVAGLFGYKPLLGSQNNTQTSDTTTS